MKKTIIIYLAGMFLTFLLLGPVIPFKEVSYSMCRISGSKKYNHNYYLFTSSEEIKSPLEEWILKNHNKNFKPKYKGYGFNTIYLHGNRALGCGNPPRIYSIAYNLRGILNASSNSEISKLVKALEKGNAEEIGQEFSEASERYSDYLDSEHYGEEINN